MAVKKQRPPRQPVHSYFAAPFMFLDILADFHLGRSAEDIDAAALRGDWEVVGDCIWVGMEAQRQRIVDDRQKNDR